MDFQGLVGSFMLQQEEGGDGAMCIDNVECRLVCASFVADFVKMTWDNRCVGHSPTAVGCHDVCLTHVQVECLGIHR